MAEFGDWSDVCALFDFQFYSSDLSIASLVGFLDPSQIPLPAWCIVLNNEH